MSVTKVSSLHIYPIKSTAGISLPQAQVEELGLAFDRRFVVSDPLGQFITARTEPRLCLVQTILTEQGLVLSAPKMSTLTLSYKNFTARYQNVTVWGDEIAGQLCANAANAWFSDYLQRPCQLLFFGQDSYRERKANTDKARKLAFADGYPLLLISQASLHDLNQRLKNNHQQAVSMAQFRPNIVVENCLPFAEDGWQHIRIGEVEFTVSKSCERCILTTVDPQTGEKHPEQQPLRTLKSFRQVSNSEVLFGQNLIARNKGVIEQGDKLVVIETKRPPVFSLASTTNTTQPTLIDNNANNARHKLSNKAEETVKLTCQQIISETHDVKTFVFSWAGKSQIKQLAGQHINLLVNIFGSAQPCCYTIASGPSLKNQISLTIKRVPNGKVSNFFHDHFKVGDTVKARTPSGHFHLPENIPKRVLLLSAGSGITPMLSMLRFMTKQQINNQIIFFHSARSEQDLIAKDEIDRLAKQHGNCQVVYTLTQQVKPQWQGYQGHLSQQMLTNIEDLLLHDVYVCGPEGFRQTAQQHLRQLGLSKQKYHYETFGAKITIAPAASPKSEVATAKSANKKLTIYFEKWQKTYQIPRLNNQASSTAKTLLEHGEDAGLILPYSCQAGMCGSCKAKLVSGEVVQSATEGLTIKEQQEGYVLCCSSIAKSDVVIKHD